MQVFGDDAAAVDLYFALRHRDEDMLVWQEDGEIGGMLSMLPVSLCLGKAAYPSRYIYAVATAPALRGRGIASALLTHASGVIAERGEAAALLSPATDSLFGYYEKRGYRTAFSLSVAQFRASDLPPCPEGCAYAQCSTSAYARIRDRAFAERGLYARWDERALAYALRTLGGGAGRLTLAGGEGVVAWSRTEGCVLVRELGLVGVDIPKALAVLHGALGAPAYRVRLPAGDWPGAITPFGMIRWCIPEPACDAPGYLALALD